MTSEKKGNWYLYNSLTENKINALSQSQARDILSKIEKSEVEFWFAWNKEMTDWKQVESLHEFKNLFNEKIAPPPPPPPPPGFGPPRLPKSSKTNGDHSTPVARDPVFQEKRKHKRYAIELKIIFKKENAIFRTFTKNISLGGVALKNPVPEEFMTEECEIILSSPEWNENIKFAGRIAENINTRSRVQFVETKEFFAEKLEQWLQELNQQDENSKRKIA